MQNSIFKKNFAALLAKAGDKAALVVRKTALDLQGQMIEMSPVDTGRFKGNWQAGVGGVNTDTSAAAGSDAKGRTAVVLEGWKPGQTIYLTNSLSYARPLEYGHSKQAPGGVVRLTAQRYSEAVARAVQEVKS